MSWRTWLPHRAEQRVFLGSPKGIKASSRLFQLVGGRRWSLVLLTDLKDLDR
ncbi:hypothetical protein SEA_SCENTAE_221 [Gordonia phage SCentae]|nr:hypothetical protein SEA_SCENTAE_221 [Gordonia phage SCentae]